MEAIIIPNIDIMFEDKSIRTLSYELYITKRKLKPNVNPI